MKRPNNRRSKRSSVTDFTPPAGDEVHDQQQHFDNKRVVDLKNENEALKMEIEGLKQQKAANLSPSPIDGLRKVKDDDDDSGQKLRVLEVQVTDLKKKFNDLTQISARKNYSSPKQQSSNAGSFHDQIQRLKVQKVQLFCKMKLDSVQFRLSKASLEKEILQLKKEERRKDYEIRKLLALNEKQKLVLQQKTKEACMATKRLNELLESRKASAGTKGGKSPGVQVIEIELKVAARVEEIRADYEREMQEMADELRKFEEDAETLRQENFRCLIQDKEVECIVRDSELRDLKEEIVRLSNLVSQPGKLKAEDNRKKLEVDLVKPYSSSAASGAISDYLDTSDTKYSGGNTAPQMCCSCSKKSLCKTLKCECRAAGGTCGAQCGCTTSKCTNRSTLFIKMDDSLQRKEEAQGKSEPHDLDNGCMPGPRKPFQDIGNALANSSPTATKPPGKKIRGRKLMTNIAAGTCSSVALADNQMRQTRAKRSQTSK